MQKRVHLKNGETILILEKLKSYTGDNVYYKIQSQDGSLSIIESDVLNALISEGKQSSQLTTPQKLQLFYDYFRGRPDVYATKWQSKSGKVGFSPHGDGEWVVKEGRSQKEIHTYYPYTLQTVNDHIRAEKYDFRLGAGIYPMLENDCTYLVVIDFDKEGAEEEAKAVVQVCREFAIELLMERSQSGNGIHLWVFFEDEIKAGSARYLAQLILRHAMAHLEVLQFTSYDRIIPMQDSLPKNGFGNIIALPLRADKVMEGKTVFLTDDLEVVDDQWEELASTIKYSKADVELFIEKLEESLPVQLYKQGDEKPSIALPDKLKVIKTGELKIEKSSISRKALIQLAHLATIHNPEFYKKQNMRMPTWDTPQFITSASEDENYLYLPRGIEGKLNELDIAIEYVDNLNSGYPIEVTFKGLLREKQIQAVEEMLANETGIISAPTGFGKTVVAASLIAERKTSTLIIVHSKVLADQWKERLHQFLDIKSEPFVEYTPTGRVRKKGKIGEVHSGKENLSHTIDIALFQTLANRENLTDLLNQYGMVIVDEAHHVAAKTFEEVIKQVNARFLYGLTATPERKDGLTPILFMRLGDLIFEEKEELSESLLMPKFFYPRFTNYSDFNPELTYNEHLNQMAETAERNDLILSDIVENMREGRTCLVLTERVAHISVLEEALKEVLENVPVYTLSSQQKKQENQKILEEMRAQKVAYVTIATSQIAGEGLDLPQLESIFFCLPFSYKVRTQQYVGRLHRGLDEKDELRVYDYVDIGVEVFARMYQKRLREYSKLNYKLAEDDKTRAYQTQLYTASNYLEPLNFDLSKASQIVLGIYSISQIQIDEWKEWMASRIEMEILIKRDKLEKSPKLFNELKKLGVKVTLLDANPYSFVLCDEKIIWYGNLKYFSKNTADATILRLSNKDIADKIMRQYKR